MLRRAEAAAATASAMMNGLLDLHPHGSAVRCLLRLCEQAGQTRPANREFFARYLPRFPAWRERPGRLTAVELEELACDLGLAKRIEWIRDYGRLVVAQADGDRILALTEHPPLPTGIGRRPHVTTSLVVALDAGGFSLWWPSPAGDAQELPRAAPVWWTRWPARAAVLRQD